MDDSDSCKQGLGASPLKPLLTIGETAELFGCRAGIIEDYLHAGRLPGVKFGKSWVIPLDALLRRLNRMAEEQAEARAKGLSGKIAGLMLDHKEHGPTVKDNNGRTRRAPLDLGALGRLIDEHNASGEGRPAMPAPMVRRRRSRIGG